MGRPLAAIPSRVLCEMNLFLREPLGGERHGRSKRPDDYSTEGARGERFWAEPCSMRQVNHDCLMDLECAVCHLEEALARPKDEIFRDASIKRFEYAFEAMWRSLEVGCQDAGIRIESPHQSVLQSSLRLGVISEDDRWSQMLTDRIRTGHLPDLRSADEIYSRLPGYASLMRDTLREIRSERPVPLLGGLA